MVKKKYSRREMLFFISCAIVIILILSFYVWHQMEYVRMGYEIGKLEEKVLSLKKDVQRLEAKKSSLLSLERIEKIARKELKLNDPKKEQVIYSGFSP